MQVKSAFAAGYRLQLAYKEQHRVKCGLPFYFTCTAVIKPRWPRPALAELLNAASGCAGPVELSAPQISRLMKVTAMADNAAPIIYAGANTPGDASVKGDVIPQTEEALRRRQVLPLNL